MTQDEIRAEHRRLAEMFPRFHHSTSIYTRPLDPERQCDCPECPNKAAVRIVVNIWGTVQHADVCHGHAEMNGKAIDDLRTGPPAANLSAGHVTPSDGGSV
jgi:hypothetical protein